MAAAKAFGLADPSSSSPAEGGIYMRDCVRWMQSTGKQDPLAADSETHGQWSAQHEEFALCSTLMLF